MTRSNLNDSQTMAAGRKSIPYRFWRSGALALTVEPAPVAAELAAEKVEADQRDGLAAGGGEPDRQR